MSYTATIVVDLGFGDAGKGTIVDFLAREMRPAAVVRFNGGAQAAHNVHTADGRHHTFAQFGSGSFVPGVRTHLSRFMLIDPDALKSEAEHLREIGCGNVFARLSVDEDARVVTPFHKAANRLREIARGADQHGTCGMGIGETMSDDIARPELTIRARDLRDPEALSRKLVLVQEYKCAQLRDVIAGLSKHPLSMAARAEFGVLFDTSIVSHVADSMWRIGMQFVIVPGSYLGRLAKQGNLIFEGAQGVLLDEWYGFHPHTTWSTTTCANALELLNEIEYAGHIEKLGVLRAYFTRHGAGPMPTEDAALTTALPESHNSDGGWQGVFRNGWFDLVLARYALAVCGDVDSIALTNLDRFATLTNRKVATSYVAPDLTSVTTLPTKTVLTDLDTQEALMHFLKTVTPQYLTLPNGLTTEGYVRFIEEALQVPISITSAGTTAADKFFRSRLTQAA